VFDRVFTRIVSSERAGRVRAALADGGITVPP
jgi:hypothetical protein